MQHTKRVFLVHGWEGRPHNHWFPWLRRELAERGFAVFAPAMPDADHPKLHAWIEHLNRAVVGPDEHTYFVGHSLGCITTVRYLNQLPEKTRVGGCVFVAGFSGNIGYPEIAEFYMPAEEVEKVKNRCPRFVTIFSDDDEDVPLEKGKKFQQELSATLVVEKNKGHFTKDRGVTELQSALDAVLQVSGFSPRR